MNAGGQGGVVRKHPSETETDSESPSKPPKSKKAALSDRGDELWQLTAAIKSLETKLEESIEENRSYKAVVENKLEEMSKNMEKHIEKLRGEFEKKLTTIQTEVGELKGRIETIEDDLEDEPFDPEVTIVVMGMSYEEEENLNDKVDSLLQEGLETNLRAANTMRTPMKGSKPGIVKIEFQNKSDKITALRKKQMLKKKKKFEKLYMRSAFPHAERVAQYNTQVLLREIGAEKRFQISGSGKLVEKSNDPDRIARPETGENGQAVDDNEDEEENNQRETPQGQVGNNPQPQRERQQREPRDRDRREEYAYRQRGSTNSGNRGYRGRGSGRGGPRRGNARGNYGR